METQKYSLVHNPSEKHKSWYESESDSDSEFSRPHSSPSSLQQDFEQSCTLIITSIDYSTIYPLLNLHLNGIRISVGIDTKSGKRNMTKRLVEQLRLPIENRTAPLHVKGFGGKNDIINAESHVHIDGNNYNFNIIKKICGTLPAVTKAITNTWVWLRTKKLSTVFPRPSTDPQILIDLNHISKLLTNTENCLTLRNIFPKSGLGPLDTKHGLVIFGSYSRQPIIQYRNCGCNSAPQTTNEKTITLTAKSYIDTLLCSMFEVERCGIEDKEEQLTNGKMSADNCNQNYEIRDLRDGSKRFGVRLNRLPLESRHIIEGTLKYALARWKQLEIEQGRNHY